MVQGSGPEFWLVAGSNGAGKTTFVSGDGFEAVIGRPLTVLDPDRIAREIASSGLVSASQVDLKAVQQIEQNVAQLIERGESFLVETVLSTNKYIKHVHRAKQLGYRVGMIYVGLPTPEMAIARVADRVMKGGHSVPEDKIRARWHSSHRMLGDFLPLVDQLEIFANLTAGSPVLVARKRNGVLELMCPGILPAVDGVIRSRI
jgi:predicted ABC-type ATPase